MRVWSAQFGWAWPWPSCSPQVCHPGLSSSIRAPGRHPLDVSDASSPFLSVLVDNFCSWRFCLHSGGNDGQAAVSGRSHGCRLPAVVLSDVRQQQEGAAGSGKGQVDERPLPLGEGGRHTPCSRACCSPPTAGVSPVAPVLRSDPSARVHNSGAVLARGHARSPWRALHSDGCLCRRDKSPAAKGEVRGPESAMCLVDYTRCSFLPVMPFVF